MGALVLLGDGRVLRILGRIGLGERSDVLARQWRSDVDSRAATGDWTEDGDLATDFLFGCYFVIFAGLLIVLLGVGFPGSQRPVAELVASVVAAVPGGLAILHGVALKIPGRIQARRLGATFIGCALPPFVMTLVLLHQS